MIGHIASSTACVVCVAAVLNAPAHAQIVESDFFNNRQIRLIVGADAGGGYDTYARVVSSHLARHLPSMGATIVVQNMPGAGSLVALNYIYNIASKDGSVIAAINPNSISEPLFSPDKAKYDSRKLGWIGSVARDTEVILAGEKSGISRFEDLFEKEFLAGSTGGASAASTLPRLLNGILGTKIKLVEGYKGANNIIFAILAGEVNGYGSASWSGMRNSHQELFNSGKLKVVAHYGASAIPSLSGVPSVISYAKTDEQRAVFLLMLSSQETGRPFLTPPDVPRSVLDSYRTAFKLLVKDSAFLSEMKTRMLDVDPLDGEQTQRVVDGIFATQSQVVQHVRKLLDR